MDSTGQPSAPTEAARASTPPSHSGDRTAARSPQILGLPLGLLKCPAVTILNRQFARFDPAEWDRFYLPSPMASLVDRPPLARRDFVEDDDRSAVDPVPAATLDGLPFLLSVKGVGPAIDPFAHRPLDRPRDSGLTVDPDTRRRLADPPTTGGPLAPLRGPRRAACSLRR
jgi:hypothetical protein